MRNLAAKVPEDRWPEFKARATACYQAPSRAIARDLAAGVIADFETELATAVPVFHRRLRGRHRAFADAGDPPSGDPNGG